MKTLTYEQIVEELKNFNLKNPFLLVLVGLPGSGKSTFVNKLKTEFVIHVASTDDLVEREAQKLGLNYSDAFQRVNQKQLRAEMNYGITSAVNRGSNIVNDQTNMGGKKRRGLTESINDYYIKIAIIFDLDDKILYERLDKRAIETGKTIPRFVITEMISNYTTPTNTEGFNFLWKIQQ